MRKASEKDGISGPFCCLSAYLVYLNGVLVVKLTDPLYPATILDAASSILATPTSQTGLP